MLEFSSSSRTREVRRRAAAWVVAIGVGALGLAAAPRDGVASTAARIATSYKLPISRPFDQGDSDLCWIYATLSMLETNYLEKHPRSTIELSRGALQSFSIADRLRRQVAGSSSRLEDGGVAVDAVDLIRRNGLIANRDFHGAVDSNLVFHSISKRLSKVAGQSRKLAALNQSLANALGVPPPKTQLDGKELTPETLARVVLGRQAWTEFDVARDGVARTGPSDDPDARPGTQARHVGLPTVIDLIRVSLARGQAVVWSSTDDHALLIYGGDYDANGRPVAYWIKDSSPPYTYRAKAADIHRVLTDVTVAVSSPDDAAATARN